MLFLELQQLKFLHISKADYGEMIFAIQATIS